MTKRVLAVDDETDVQLILKTALQSEGFEVETAGNGADALALARENPPDLVLLDVMMPGMTGFEVLRELKSDDTTSMIPVIMLAGVSERSKIQEALTSGSDYYIIKPFDHRWRRIEMSITGAAKEIFEQAVLPLLKAEPGWKQLMGTAPRGALERQLQEFLDVNMSEESHA